MIYYSETNDSLGLPLCHIWEKESVYTLYSRVPKCVFVCVCALLFVASQLACSKAFS